MAPFRSARRVPAVLGACIAVAVAGMGSAQAFVLENTPTLPLIDFPYTTGGGDCFNTAGFCVTGSAFTLTSVVPSGFVQTADETITAFATDTIDLANLSNMPIGTVTLTGTVTQVVLGRLNPSDTGSWTVDLTGLSLAGTLNGFALTMGLNPADLSMDSGTTSIVQDGAFFEVNSFFDVFTEITYDVPGGPLHATPSGTATATAAPEPATLALLAVPVLAMSAVRRRRRES